MKFKPLLFFSWVILCLLCSTAFAQNKTITGKVTDKKDGSPLIGVSVLAKGTSVGGNTDADGVFKINVPAATTTLVLTYVGYTRQEVAIGSRTQVNVALTGEATSLNEVVVIGYGTQRVKDATGSVASLSPKDYNKGVIASPEQLLQGRISGVQVTPSSGEPGASVNINIRGASSIRAGNTPLFVVDGVPLDGGGTSGGLDAGGGTSSARNPLAFLNPNDIENISVLKDASAAAIYGSRGANGVVLITTKKGASGQGIQFSANGSVSSAARQYDLLNSVDFLQLAERAGATPSVIDQKASTDWQDVIFRTGVSQNYNLGYGDAKGSTSYRLNFGYDDQKGIVENSGLKRLTGRLNASQSLFKNKVKIDLAFTASNVRNQYAPITDNAGFEGSLIGAAILANPTYPIMRDGVFYAPDGNFRNPAGMLEYINDNDKINRYLGNINGTWNILKSLSYKVTFGFDRSKSDRETYFDSRINGYNGQQGFRSINVNGASGNGRGANQTQKLLTNLIEHTLTYDNKFGVHGLNILGGYSYQEFRNFAYNDIAFNQTDKTNSPRSLGSFSERLNRFGDSTKYELQSYFTRANYSYNDKYLLTFTLRADGSSKFGSNNKYGYFPAGAFRWKIMNESFAPKKVFDDLSLRLNYGQTGNQEFPPYASLAIRQTQLNGSVIAITNASPNLKWQTDTQYGAGIDFSILKGRLNGTVDYFNKSTKNLIFLIDYPAPSAATRRWINLPGNVVNRGFEVGLNFNAIKKDLFNWDIQYNMTFVRNKVEDFGSFIINTGEIRGQGLSGSLAQRVINNYSLGSFYLPTWTGYDANGISTYVGGGDGFPTVVGNAIPKVTAGLTNNFSYGKFSLSLFFNAAAGYYIYNNTANGYFLKGSLKNGRNVSYASANDGDNALNAGSPSTRFLEKGDFVRLSNATLGYTFDLKNNKAIKNLRLSLSGQNLFLITNYSGLDPEVNSNNARDNVPSIGIDYTSYPSARTFTLSLNAGF